MFYLIVHLINTECLPCAKHCSRSWHTVGRKARFQLSWNKGYSGEGTQWVEQFQYHVLSRSGTSLRKRWQDKGSWVGSVELLWIECVITGGPLRRWHLNWGSGLCDSQVEERSSTKPNEHGVSGEWHVDWEEWGSGDESEKWFWATHATARSWIYSEVRTAIGGFWAEEWQQLMCVCKGHCNYCGKICLDLNPESSDTRAQALNYAKMYNWGIIVMWEGSEGGEITSVWGLREIQDGLCLAHRESSGSEVGPLLGSLNTRLRRVNFL